MLTENQGTPEEKGAKKEILFWEKDHPYSYDPQGGCPAFDTAKVWQLLATTTWFSHVEWTQAKEKRQEGNKEGV